MLLKKIFKNKFSLFVLIILAIFLPFTLTTPAESDNKTLAVAIGFDKQDDEIEVSAQFIVPQFAQGFTMSLKSISAKAQSPANAVDKMSLNLGKKIGLAHCDVVIFGKGYENEDLGKAFDYLLRGKKIGKNSIIIYTEGTAKELINESLQLSKNMDLSLKKILNFNEKLLFSKQNTVDNFLNNYFDKNSLSFASVVNVEENQNGVSTNDGQGSNGSSTLQSDDGGSTSSSSSQQSSSSKKVIVNDGKTAIFKNGKLAAVLEPKLVREFTWLNSGEKVMITLKNVNTDLLTNAELVIEVDNKNISYDLSFKNGKPVVKAKLNVLVELNTVKNENQYVVKDINKSFINNVVKDKIKEFIINDISNALAFAKENKIDFFYFYDLFYRYKNKELKQYLSNKTNDQFIQDVQLFTEINVSKTV